MPKPHGVALFLLLLVPVLAGCVSESRPPPGSTPNAPAQATLQSVLEAIPAPDGFDRQRAVDWWESFVTTYSRREWNWPQNAAAAEFLETELRTAGYQAETLTVRVPGSVGPLGLPIDGDFRVVHGIRPGEGNASHRLVLISHYDIVPQTLQGAYDDGSGVAAEMELCKLLAKLKTNKTIECIFFDGEEYGLAASSEYVRQYTESKPNYTWDQAFGYDMVGLNWPGHDTWKLYAFIGLDEANAHLASGHEDFLRQAFYEFLGPKLGVSTKGVEVLDKYDRNSDESNFAAAGIPVVRFAGGRRAADYPQYHRPGDTTFYVYQFACDCTDLAQGKEKFSLGLEMVVKVSYYTILASDKFNPLRLPF